MYDFVPDEGKTLEVPYFEDVTSEQGWKGHTTSKSIGKLKSEVMQAVQRLGGLVVNFQRGTFSIDGKERVGWKVHYVVERDVEMVLPGCMSIAALPVKKDHRKRRSEETRLKGSMKMALYMFRDAMDGLWFLQHLSPGYAPLMPWVLTDGGKTVSQHWLESPTMRALLPPEDADFIEGEVVEDV